VAQLSLLERYRDFLPLTAATPAISLGEGDTPLVRSARLGPAIGCGALYFKLEGCNPTGSFKDRGMVMAVAKAIEVGSRAIMCGSTGNTSSSAAAYAAHCGLDAAVVVPRGYIAVGKLAQALVYGARVVAIDGNFDQALAIVRELTARYPVTLVNSVNPFRLEGQKTAAFEVVDALDDAPDYLFIPVGNAGNISAYWRGFREYRAAGRSSRLPRMMGFEAEGAAPIVRGAVVAEPRTLATAIRIGNPASWRLATAARDESGGAIDCVTDAEIVAAYLRLGREEGLFVEPASAAAVAGLLKLTRAGLDLSRAKVVCVLTGNGLKDPDTALQHAPALLEAPSDGEQVAALLGWT
jgi:threonine synthase